MLIVLALFPITRRQANKSRSGCHTCGHALGEKWCVWPWVGGPPRIMIDPGLFPRLTLCGSHWTSTGLASKWRLGLGLVHIVVSVVDEQLFSGRLNYVIEGVLFIIGSGIFTVFRVEPTRWSPISSAESLNWIKYQSGPITQRSGTLLEVCWMFKPSVRSVNSKVCAAVRHMCHALRENRNTPTELDRQGYRLPVCECNFLSLTRPLSNKPLNNHSTTVCQSGRRKWPGSLMCPYSTKLGLRHFTLVLLWPICQTEAAHMCAVPRKR